MSNKYAYKATAVDGIYTRHGRLYIVATVGGQRIRRPAVCDSGTTPATQLQQARDELAKLQADAAKAKIEGVHDVKRPKRMEWREAAKRYLEKRQNRRSLRQIAGRVLWLEETEILAGLHLDEITIEHVEAVYQARKDMGNKCTSALHFVTLIRTIMRFARKKKWVSEIPEINESDFHDDEPEGAFDDSRDRVLDYDEEDRLLATIAPHLQDVVRLALATGLRKKNVFGLKWEYIKDGVCTIPGRYMKNKEEHSFPLDDDALEILDRNRNDTEWVFLYQGNQLKDLDHAGWQGALKRAQIEDFRFHDLRRTYGTRQLLAGVPEHAVQKLGAWKDIKVLYGRYYKPKANDLRDFANMANRPKPIAGAHLKVAS